MEEILRFGIFGLVTGSVYAVAASGLVVTYTTSGIFNIAHGAIGMLMAFTYWELRINQNWPAPVAFILVVLIIAPLFGALIERVLVRGLRNASVATSLVVTVGLMVALIGLAQNIWDPRDPRRLPGFFDPHKLKVAGVNVTWHEAATLLTAAALAVFLWLLLKRSRTGIAMRAVVDDPNLMGLNGARPERVSMLAWAIGASLASLAGILLAPILQMDVIVLTLLVVNCYAAAMFGRLRSLPLTFAGAILLGLIESYTIAYVNLSGWLIGLRPALPVLFLFIILLVLPEQRLRAGRLVGTVMPRVPGSSRAAVGGAGLVVAAGAVSLFLTSANLIRAGQGLAYGIIMLSLVLLTGYGGQVSLCQISFAGVGAFAMAQWGGDGSIVGILAAGALAAVVGGLIALPSLRLQGLYLALSTMAFALLMEHMFFKNDHVFGFGGAKAVGRLDLPGVSFDSDRAYFVLLAIVFALFGMFVLWIKRGPFGRVLTAMRDSPIACATLGLSLTRTKLAVFMIAAGMAGIGGALLGGLKTDAGSQDFLMLYSLPLLLLAVIGGITSVSGALIGGMLYALPSLVPIAWVADYQYLFTGIGAVTVGRNQNGIAFQISEQLRKVLAMSPRRTAPPRPAEGMPQSEMEMEEVPGVVAAG
ncbi:MAG: ABC transporter permease [Actinomycetota bacterium]